MKNTDALGQRHKSRKQVIIFLACLLIVPVRKSLRDSSCLFHIRDGQISLQCHNTKKDQDQRIFEPGRWDAIFVCNLMPAIRCFCQFHPKNLVKKNMLRQNLLHQCTFQLLQPCSLPNKILEQLQHPSCWDPMHLPKSPYLAGQHEPWNTQKLNLMARTQDTVLAIKNEDSDFQVLQSIRRFKHHSCHSLNPLIWIIESLESNPSRPNDFTPRNSCVWPVELPKLDFVAYSPPECSAWSYPRSNGWSFRFDSWNTRGVGGLCRFSVQVRRFDLSESIFTNIWEKKQRESKGIKMSRAVLTGTFSEDTSNTLICNLSLQNNKSNKQICS